MGYNEINAGIGEMPGAEEGPVTQMQWRWWGVRDGVAWGYDVLAEFWLPRKRNWLYWWTGYGG